MTAIHTHQLTKFYGTKPAVAEVSLEIPKGQITALIGRNGAGKTSLIRMIMGMIRPSWGEVEVLGKAVDALDPHDRGRIGYLAEKQPLYEWMSIGQMVRFTRSTYPQFSKHLFEHYREMADWGAQERKIRELSRGQKAQLCLALVLACRPELLILDDPTAGVDPRVRRDFLTGILEMIVEDSRTVLFSTQHMGDVERIADRVVMLHAGRVVANCTLSDFRSAFTAMLVTFTGQAPTQPDLPGLLAWQVSGREAELLCLSDAEEVRARLADLGAAELAPREHGMEDLMVSFSDWLERSAS